MRIRYASGTSSTFVSQHLRSKGGRKAGAKAPAISQNQVVFIFCATFIHADTDYLFLSAPSSKVELTKERGLKCQNQHH